MFGALKFLRRRVRAAAAFRTLLAPAIIMTIAVGCRERAAPPDEPLPVLTTSGGPEIVVLRLTREGGFPRSYRWPTIDVPAWTGSERLPAIQRLLAFDDGAGLLAFVADDGRAGRIDVQSGRVSLSPAPLALATSADGATLVGLTKDQHLWRSAPASEWTGPSYDADTAIALPGGFLVLVSHDGETTRLVRTRPPAPLPFDTLEIPRATAFTRTPGGDRIFVRTERGAVAVDARAWRTVPAPRAGTSPLAIEPSPSGDRAFVLDGNGTTLRIWSRYGERFVETVELPFTAADLRVDPMGRYLLLRPELTDTAIVMSVPLLRILRSFATEWRDDLPTVAPDGSLLVLRGSDVNVMDVGTGARKRRVRGGARDAWMFVRWDGFKPRDSSLDLPATFETEVALDSVAEAEKIDSLLSAHAEIVERERMDSVARASARSRTPVDTAVQSYTLSFASLLSESAARALAARIRVDGRPPRIVAGTRDGITVYRVVLGPYTTRDAAEAAGRRSGVPFWVFAGLP